MKRVIDMEIDIRLRLAEAQISVLKEEHERLKKSFDSLLNSFATYISSQNEEVRSLCKSLRKDIKELIKNPVMTSRPTLSSDELRNEFRWEIDGKPYGIIIDIKKEKE